MQAASGSLVENSGAIVTAANLIANAGQALSFADANQVATLAAQAGGAAGFANAFALTVGAVPAIDFVAAQSGVTAGGAVALTTKTGGLTLAGNIAAAGQTVTLNAAGAIDQPAGVITAALLQGQSVGGADFDQNNLVGTFASFANTGGALGLVNAQTLTAGPLSNLNGAITLTTVGAGSNLIVAGNLTAATLALNSAGTIAQNAGTVLTAGTLTGSSAGGASLGGANQVAVFGAFGNSGGGDIVFDNAAAVALGAIGNPAGSIAVTTTGAASDIFLAGPLAAPGNTVTLVSSRLIQEQAGGSIAAATLTGSSAGAAAFAQPGNSI